MSFFKSLFKADTSSNAKEYDMNHERRGIALLINNEIFSDGRERKGSQADVYALSLALTKLDFQVELHQNCTAKEMSDLLIEYEKRDCGEEDCFLCAVMSYGDKGVVMGADCMPCREEDLMEPIKRNKSLEGKPKIFFIQACQGELFMQNVIESDSVTSSVRSIYLPFEADLFVQCSNVEGYMSFRNSKGGTWFIQTLASVLNERGKKDELHKLALQVNNEVAMLSRNEYIQISRVNSLLRFKVFFPAKRNSTKIQEYEDGFYIGQIKKNKRYGKGRMIYKDGRLYDGDWLSDEWTGEGVLIYANGDRYQGQFLRNQREGTGKMHYKSGNDEEGVWMYDKCVKILSKNYLQPLRPLGEYPAVKYNMNHERRGIAVIINNHTFSDGGERKGLQADVYELCLALTRLDFRVELYHNCTVQEMTDVVSDCGNHDCTNEDCFMCVVLSCGHKRAVMGADCKPLGANDLMEPIKRNKSLEGKPKIFFIQACRTELNMKNKGNEIDADRAEASSEAILAGLPGETDVLVQCSSVEEYESWHPEKSSWFIQKLTSILREHGNKEDIYEMALQLNNEWAKETNDVHSQISIISSTLRFKVNFLAKMNMPTLQENEYGFCVGQLDENTKKGMGRIFYKDGSVFDGEWENYMRMGKGIFVNRNGDRYEGEFMNDRMHGRGTMCYKNGDIYEGDWVKDEPSGDGVRRLKSGSVSEGQFMNGKLHGKGRMLYENGDVYEGEWISDWQSGEGIYIFANGDQYAGQFIKSKRHGKGKMCYKSGKIEVGNWAEDTLINLFEETSSNEQEQAAKYQELSPLHIGFKDDERPEDKNTEKESKTSEKIKIHYISGKDYEGDLVDGKRSGNGFLKFPDGNRYKGQFLDNKMHGTGKMLYKNGDIYEGEWAHDAATGEGVYHYANGDRYEGKFLDNKRHGKGKMFYKNRDIYEGDWAIDKQSGKGIKYYNNGGVYEGDWADGKQSGYGVFNYANGDRYEGQFQDDKREGNGRMRYESGREDTGQWTDDRIVMYASLPTDLPSSRPKPPDDSSRKQIRR